MAWAALTSHGAASNKAAGTNFTLPIAGANIAAGNVIVLVAALDNIQTTDGDTTLVSSVTLGSQTFTKVAEYTNGQGGAASGATVWVGYLVANTSYTTGISIITINHSSVAARGAVYQAFSATGTNPTISFEDITSSPFDALDPPGVTTTGTPSENRQWLAIHGLASEQPNTATLTPDSTFTGFGTQGSGQGGTSGGGSASNMTARAEYRIVTTGSAVTANAALAASDGAHTIFLMKEVAGAQLVSTGVATETDTALALADIKIRTTGTSTETDSAQTLGRVKSRTAGTATETDSGAALGRVKVRATGTSAETDAALAAQRVKLRATGTSSETDTALAPTVENISGAIEVPTGTASETDAAQALSRVKISATGTATETDAALGIAPVKQSATGTASETDASLGLAAVKLRATGTSTETNTALAPVVGNVGAAASGYFGATFFGAEHFASNFYRVDAATQTIAVGIATETDAALAPVVEAVAGAFGYFNGKFFGARHFAADFYTVEGGAVIVPPGPQPDVGQRVTFWTRDDYREWKAERRNLAARARKLKKKLATVAEDAPDELAARVATLQRAKVQQDDISGLRDLVERLEILIAVFAALKAAEDAEEDDIEILLLAA